MSERRPSLLIKDILHFIYNCILLTFRLKNFCQLFNNRSCLYNIHVIGEAVSKIPADIKEQENQISWQLIKGMRNRLIHEYFGTELQLVWNIIHNELPSFRIELQVIFTKLIEQVK